MFAVISSLNRDTRLPRCFKANKHNSRWRCVRCCRSRVRGVRSVSPLAVLVAPPAAHTHTQHYTALWHHRRSQRAQQQERTTRGVSARTSPPSSCQAAVPIMAGPLSQDPFYIVRQEIQEQVAELQTKMSRFHGLTAANPERRTIANAVTDGCESLKWQVNELDSAVNRAAEQPQRFGLTPEEISSRRKWISTTRRQVEGMLDTIKTATAAPANPVETKLAKANEGFLNGEGGKQQLLLRQQDDQLGDIEQAVSRLGRVGLTIHEELQSQGQMLDELDEEVDTTHSRLRATQKKVLDVIKKSGTTTQLSLIVFLMIILVVLAVVAFM